MRRASLFSPQSSPTILAMTAGKITATWRQVWRGRQVARVAHHRPCRDQRGSGSHSADREGSNQDGAVLLRPQHVPQLILLLFLVDGLVIVPEVYPAS